MRLAEVRSVVCLLLFWSFISPVFGVFCSELQQHPGRASTQNPDADTPGLSAGGRGQGDTHLVWASGRRTGLVDVFGVT